MDPVRENGGGPLTSHCGKDNKRYIKRDVTMPCQWVSLSVGAPLWYLKGIHSLEIFEKEDSICGFFLDPEDIKILSLEAIWNFNKGTGLS